MLTFINKKFFVADEASNFKTNLIQDYTKHCQNILWNKNSSLKESPKTRPKAISVDFTRQFVKNSKLPEELILIMRNPYEILISMQLKQASLASNDLKSSIFQTEAWTDFATSGTKAWYAHTRGWICGSVNKLSVLHYEDFTNNYEHGKRENF